MPPPNDFQEAYAILYGWITQISSQFASMHTQMKSQVEQEISNKADPPKDEDVSSHIKPILEGAGKPGLPTEMTFAVGAEPSPFDMPAFLQLPGTSPHGKKS